MHTHAHLNLTCLVRTRLRHTRVCACACSLSRLYLMRPAARSEMGGALYGPDPSCLAARALADAQRVVATRPQWAKAHALKVGGRAGGVGARVQGARRSSLCALRVACINTISDGMHDAPASTAHFHTLPLTALRARPSCCWSATWRRVKASWRA